MSPKSPLNIPWLDRLSPWVASRCPLSAFRVSPDCPLSVPLLSPIWSNVYQIFKHSSKSQEHFYTNIFFWKTTTWYFVPKIEKKTVLMIEKNNNLFEYWRFSTDLKKQTNLQENIFLCRTLWTDRELESGNDSCQGHVANHIFSQAKKRRYVAVLSLDPTQCKNL